MIVWINGVFGSGKTSVAYELHRRLPDSHVYDPENVGDFIRRNAPEQFSKGDFQDIPLWREINYKMLRLLNDTYSGTIIVPMTLVNPQYHNEIAGRLRSDGALLRHFILYAGKETILRRLKRRNLGGWFRKESFAVNAIDRCLHAFNTTITEEKIDTERNDVRAVTEIIAEKCGLALILDHQNILKRKLDQAGVWIKHIR